MVVEIGKKGSEDNPVSTEGIAEELSKITGIDIDDIIITTKLGDEGRRVRMLVHVDDEDTADKVAVEVKSKCESCEGAFCRCSTKVREVTQIQSLSVAHSCYSTKLQTFMFFVILFIFNH